MSETISLEKQYLLIYAKMYYIMTSVYIPFGHDLNQIVTPT